MWPVGCQLHHVGLSNKFLVQCVTSACLNAFICVQSTADDVNEYCHQFMIKLAQECFMETLFFKISGSYGSEYKTTALWDTVPCSLLKVDRRFTEAMP
jgi:hypothetical protein